MEKADKYWLGQSPWSGTRLRLQLELTRTNFDGNLLDPRIPNPCEGALIADVATGTGTWALNIAAKHPETVVEGLDINLDEVPPQKWLPSNITFKYFNLLQDLPEDMVGRYDIVHIQYVMVFVDDHNFATVLRRLIRMLKPDGHLQWTDSDSNHWKWVNGAEEQDTPQTTKLAHMFRDLMLRTSQKTWLSSIRSSFVNAGLVDVKWMKAEPTPSSLQPTNMNWLWALQESRIVLEKRGPEQQNLIDECFEQWSRALIEAQEKKVGLDMCMVRCIGTMTHI